MFELFSDSEMPLSAREVDTQITGSIRRKVDLAAGPVSDMPGWQVLCLHDHSTMESFGEDAGSTTDSFLRGPEILAHEDQEPAGGYQGSRTALSRKIGEQDRTLTSLIESEVDRVAKLIEQMQLLSGRHAAPVEACNLHRLIRKVIAVLEAAEGGAGGLEIREEFDPSLPEVLGNPDGLVQVLLNLISNARDAVGSVGMPEIVVATRFASGIQVHSTETGEPVRLSVELRVSDNGPGVPPEIRDHLFEPFVTTKNSGQGLGLALTRKLIHDMNGRIRHERDETRGLTHFRIFLPLAGRHASGQQATGDGQ